MKNCLIVSPYYPPSALAGVHRARLLAKHLPATGWHPIVLCVNEAFHDQQLDPHLAELVPSSVEIAKVNAFPAKLSRAMGVGDISLRAWPFLKRKLFELLKTRPIAAVFITGSPYYPMLLAPSIKARFNVPVVLDFQDPWVSAWGAGEPWWRKSGVVHRLARTLEPHALNGADFVTSVSEVQNQQMASRYPRFDTTRMAALPIGGDPDDFAFFRHNEVSLKGHQLKPGAINISFVGTFMPRSTALMVQVLKALSLIKANNPELAAKICFNFVGTSNQAKANCDYRVRPLAQAEGVADLVVETPMRVPYSEALALLARSDGLLMIGSDEPHYTASKIYPGLMSGRPHLSLFHRASSSQSILSKAGGGVCFVFESENELKSLTLKIAQGLLQLACEPERLGCADPASYAPYTASSIAGQFAAIFDRVRHHG